MNKNILVQVICFAALTVGMLSCKDQLDVGNPNAPTVAANVNTESGLTSFAQGGVYINGFQNGDDWLGDSYFSLPWGYAELLADNVGADASNNQISSVALPVYYILEDGTKVPNTSSTSVDIIRAYNTRAATGAGNNAIYYQWLNMYALNNACNQVLAIVDNIEFTGDAATKANTFKAWCYWWKGYAYASIGSMYYEGLIVNEAGKTSNDYVSHDIVIAESDKYFNLAASTLSSITSISDYEEVLGNLIPAASQVGNGGVLTVDMWKRNINTMLARNILLNKLAPFVNGNPSATISGASISTMTETDWNTVKTLTTDGIKKGDYIFTGRSTETNYFFSPGGGTVASVTASINTSSSLKISERFMQNFEAGDKRFTNNFVDTSRYNNSFVYTTRYSIIDGGNGMKGVYTYANLSAGEYELLIAGTYEENALMLAEANIRLGAIEDGLGLIDNVRDYLGAGLNPVQGSGLDLAGALTELTRERRVALVFRGLSFYDNRRWGWTYDIANGGGSYNNTIVKNDGTIFTGVTINYNFMDYWDVPADETELNKPSDGRTEITNPNF